MVQKKNCESDFHKKNTYVIVKLHFLLIILLYQVQFYDFYHLENYSALSFSLINRYFYVIFQHVCIYKTKESQDDIVQLK